jgi:hypothetical protein
VKLLKSPVKGRKQEEKVDNEDKLAWCAYGEETEHVFSQQRLFDLGLAGHVNLEKKTNPFTHDLFVQFPVDLKTVTTPLFMAREMYDLNPQYTVTINHKDVTRYKQLYPNILIMFDVNWKELSKEINGNVYTVAPMTTTVAGFVSDVRRAVQKCGNKKITYKNRIDDNSGNAKESWVFDIRHLHQVSK